MSDMAEQIKQIHAKQEDIHKDIKATDESVHEIQTDLAVIKAKMEMRATEEIPKRVSSLEHYRTTSKAYMSIAAVGITLGVNLVLHILKKAI